MIEQKLVSFILGGAKMECNSFELTLARALPAFIYAQQFISFRCDIHSPRILLTGFVSIVI